MKERFEKAQTFQQFIAEETRDSNLPWQDSYQRARDRGRTTLQEIMDRIPKPV